MAMESQTERSKRLGNDGRIWHGQSRFWAVPVVPCREHVTLPNQYAVTHDCAQCQQRLKAILNEGTLQTAVWGVVVHRSLTSYEVVCQPCGEQLDMPWVHKVWEAYRRAGLPDATKSPQMSLFGGWQDMPDEEDYDYDYEEEILELV